MKNAVVYWYSFFFFYCCCAKSPFLLFGFQMMILPIPKFSLLPATQKMHPIYCFWQLFQTSIIIFNCALLFTLLPRNKDSTRFYGKFLIFARWSLIKSTNNSYSVSASLASTNIFDFKNGFFHKFCFDNSFFLKKISLQL